MIHEQAKQYIYYKGEIYLLFSLLIFYLFIKVRINIF